jgi:hypothetical protein
MKKAFRWAAAAGALSALALSGNAGATVTARTEILNLSYTLIDNAPNDGVAPSIRFTSLPAGLEIPEQYRPEGYVSTGYGYGGVMHTNHAEVTAGAPIAVSGQTDSASASVLLPGSPWLTAHAVLDAQSSPTTGVMTAYASLRSEPIRYELSPWTSVVFSLSARFTGTVIDEPGKGGENFYSWVGLVNISDDFESYGTNGVGGELASNWPSDSVDVTRTALLTGANAGYLQFYAGLRTESYAVPIPEPAVAWMFLAGAGVLAGTRRLRKA